MRVKSSVYTRQRKKKYFKIAKGSYASKSKNWSIVKQHVERSLRNAYRDRKNRKGDFRQLWIVRLNAAARELGMSYSRFMSGLRKANIDIDRKMLSELAINDSKAFEQLAQIAKETLTN